MSRTITRDEALRSYPELRTLLELSPESGWMFRYIDNGSGEVIALAGSRSVQRYTDAIFIFDRHEICAARVLDDAYDGGCVWKKEGGDLQELVYELLTLPEPGEPGAPALVKAGSLLWTP